MRKGIFWLRHFSCGQSDNFAPCPMAMDLSIHIHTYMNLHIHGSLCSCAQCPKMMNQGQE